MQAYGGINGKPLPEYVVEDEEDEYQVEESNSYLVKEEMPEKSIGLFLRLLEKGYRGLCLTRSRPDKLRRRYGINNSKIYWMTDIDTTEDHVKPDPQEISSLINEYMDKTRKAAILILRLDYLIYRNGYEKILELLDAIRDKTALGKSILLLSTNHHVLEDKELRMLEEEFISPYKENNGTLLREPVYDILRFILNQNLIRRPVAFKDISCKFGICKTTTGRRINELENERLIDLRKIGRYKMLFVTHKGRELLGT